MSEIAALAKAMGGFVVSSNLYTTYYGPNSAEAPEATITIRVPQEKLDDALKAIKEGAVEVNLREPRRRRCDQRLRGLAVATQSQASRREETAGDPRRRR
jgi:hypothetical protein